MRGVEKEATMATKTSRPLSAPLGANLQCLKALQVQLARQGGRKAWEAAAAATLAAGGDPRDRADLRVGTELASHR